MTQLDPKVQKLFDKQATDFAKEKKALVKSITAAVKTQIASNIADASGENPFATKVLKALSKTIITELPQTIANI